MAELFLCARMKQGPLGMALSPAKYKPDQTDVAAYEVVTALAGTVLHLIRTLMLILKWDLTIVRHNLQSSCETLAVSPIPGQPLYAAEGCATSCTYASETRKGSAGAILSSMKAKACCRATHRPVAPQLPWCKRTKNKEPLVTEV